MSPASGLPGGCKHSPPTGKTLQGPPGFGETTGMVTPEEQGAQPQNIITLRWHLPCWGQETWDYRCDLMQTFTAGENDSLRSFIWISTANKYSMFLLGKRKKKSKLSLALQSASASENKANSSAPNRTQSEGSQLWHPQALHCIHPCPLHRGTASRRQSLHLHLHTHSDKLLST